MRKPRIFLQHVHLSFCNPSYWRIDDMPLNWYDLNKEEKALRNKAHEFCFVMNQKRVEK